MPQINNDERQKILQRWYEITSEKSGCATPKRLLVHENARRGNQHESEEERDTMEQHETHR